MEPSGSLHGVYDAGVRRVYSRMGMAAYIGCTEGSNSLVPPMFGFYSFYLQKKFIRILGFICSSVLGIAYCGPEKKNLGLG